MAHHLNFDRIIPEEELLGHIMGPDMFGGFSYVTAVYHSPEGREGKTVCDLYPLPPDETRIVQNEYRQPKVSF